MNTPKAKVTSVENVDWDRTPHVQGRVIELGEIPDDKDKRRYATIDTGLYLIKVFESFALKEAFAAMDKGDGVDILHLGKAELANGRSIRRFRFAVFEGKTYTIPSQVPLPAGTDPAK